MSKRERSPEAQERLNRAEAAASGNPLPPKAPTLSQVVAAVNGSSKSSAPKTPKEPKVGQPCLCGCGVIAKAGSAFLPGHDARLKSQLLKVTQGKLGLIDINPAALDALRAGPVASFRLVGLTLERVGPLALLAQARIDADIARAANKAAMAAAAAKVEQPTQQVAVG